MEVPVRIRNRIFFYYRSRTIVFKGRALDPALSQAVVNHSPDGFAWGYRGSGPAQTALQLLLEFSGEPVQWCKENHQYFKDEVVAMFPQSDCDTTPQKIRNWCAMHKKRMVQTYDLEDK